MRLLDPDITLDARSLAAWRDFCRHLEVDLDRPASPETVYAYGTSLARFAVFTGGDILGVTKRQVQDYLAAARAVSRPGTVASYHRRLAAWFSWCAGDEDAPLITRSPMAGMKRPRAEEAAPAIMDAADLAALLAACRAPKDATAALRRDAIRDRAIIMVMSQAACPRASELTGMTVEGTDLAHDEYLLAGKGGVTYRIGLEPATALAVSKYLRIRPGYPAAAREAAAAATARPARGQRLWLGKAGPMTRSGLQQMLDRRAAAAGIGHVHPHKFRHTAYDRGRNAGLAPHQLEALNGWRPGSQMSRVYGRAADGRAAVAAARALNLTGAL